MTTITYYVITKDRTLQEGDTNTQTRKVLTLLKLAKTISPHKNNPVKREYRMYINQMFEQTMLPTPHKSGNVFIG